MRAIHAPSQGRNYGAPHIHAELAEQGLAVRRKRVAQVVRQAGLARILGILDMLSRRIVGWAVVKRAHPERVLNALNETVEQRQVDSVIQHADQECRQCAYSAFGERYQRWSRPNKQHSSGTTTDPI